MDSPKFPQRRKHPRVKVKWPVAMVTPEGDLDGIIENISAGGAYIRCGKPLAKKDLFILAILGQDRKNSWIGAEVIWIDITMTSNSDYAPIGMGVRFTNISKKDLRFLLNAVSKLGGYA